MPRTPPSEADRELLSVLRDEGLAVSPYQLERWRRHGLFPRATIVRRPRSHGSTARPHGRDELEIAALLAQTSAAGRPWQVGGVELFEAGLPMTQSCLRDCARWVTDAARRQVQPIWDEVTAGLSPASLRDAELLGDVAAHAADLSRRHRPTRELLANVREDLRRLHFYPSAAELEAASHEALGLRLVDMAGGARLSADLGHVARYGSVDAPAPNVPYVLHSEKLACVSTLTAREAYLMRRWLLALSHLTQLPDHLARAYLLAVVVIDVTNQRLAEPPYRDPRVPLTTEFLDEFEDSVRDAEREAQQAALADAD